MSTLRSARHAELLELIAAYAAGALQGKELQEIEAHLASGCDACHRRLAARLEEAAASSPAVAPSQETRDRILRQAATRPPAPWTPLLPWLALPAAALLALAIWAGARQERLGAEVGSLRAERDLLEHQVTALGRELVAAQSEARQITATLAILAVPEWRSVRLDGLDPAPGAAGATLIDPRRDRAVFWAFHLPATAPGTTYQLWRIDRDGPISAGTFGVDAQGRGLVEIGRLDRPEEIEAWAVTLEPAGGVPQPTGPMVLKS